MDEPVILDVTDLPAFERIPPCADTRFDHRTCDYWEDPDRGSKAARASWLAPTGPGTTDRRSRPVARDPFAPTGASAADDPFAPVARGGLGITDNPFAPTSKPAIDASALFGDDDGDDLFGAPEDNPFLPAAKRERPMRDGVPRKLALLDRGRGVFGSYAKIMRLGETSIGYAQFGPLSSYPRALRLRELYPQLPDAPLPAVITCVSTTAEARRQGHARRLVLEVCADLAERGFAAVEAYPDLTRSEDETSAGRPAFWQTCGFTTAVDDERFPVMRRELD